MSDDNEGIAFSSDKVEASKPDQNLLVKNQELLPPSVQKQNRTSQQTSRQTRKTPIRNKKADVLIITAIDEELDAFRRCSDLVGPWVEDTFKIQNNRYDCLRVTFQGKTTSLRGCSVVVTQSPDQGDRETTSWASRVDEIFKPTCLAMTGICAGYRDKIKLGDIIVADKIFPIEPTGKRLAYRESQEVILSEIELFKLKDFIKLNIKFKKSFFEESLQHQMKGKQPVSALDIETVSSPKIYIGAIGTSSFVQEDSELFVRLKHKERKILGIDRESAAIGHVARLGDKPMIIVKAVSDFADELKNDEFHDYASEASARFLLTYLKETFPFNSR